MRRVGLLVVLLARVSVSLWSQCPAAPVKLQGGHCTGDTIWVGAASQAGTINWWLDGQLYKTVSSIDQPKPATIVAGGNGLGADAKQLAYPVQIFLDSKDTLYIADSWNGRIQQFPPGSTSATNGVTITNLIHPTNGINADAVYGDNRQTLFAEESFIVYKWTKGTTGRIPVASITPAPGNVVSPAAICVDAADNVYVLEPANNRVQKWAPGATSGVTVAGGNGAGSAANQLNLPYGVCVDNRGNIYVSDYQNNRVQKWAPGATSGITVAGGNGAGSASNQLNGPDGIYADASGNLYIADGGNNRVVWWPPGAVSGITVLGGNGPGNALNQLNNPSDTFLGSDGFLYTCDNANWRVLKNIPRPDHLIDTTLALIRPGVYTAVITGQDGCTVNSDPITVIATSIVRVGLTVAPNPVCSADSAVFTGEPQAPGPVFTYQWKINDSLAVDSTSFFVYPKPVNGSTISCRVYASDGCIVGTSDTISLQVQPSPAIADGQVFPLPYGKSVQLDPKINGDVHVYSWTPGFHLSDTTVRAPVADPVTTTVYRLQVTGTDGCTDTAAIEVKVYIPLRLPNAFTPNGDGRNEIFYLLGGPPGLVILEMAVFDRWGQRVFQVRNVRPGDPSAGWTGRFGGTAMPAGTYVYTIRLRMLDGTSQVVKGAVELLR